MIRLIHITGNVIFIFKDKLVQRFYYKNVNHIVTLQPKCPKVGEDGMPFKKVYGLLYCIGKCL